MFLLLRNKLLVFNSCWLGEIDTQPVPIAKLPIKKRSFQPRQLFPPHRHTSDVQHYPKAVIQLCTNHYKENLRKTLGVRTDPTHQHFMQAIETLFARKLAKDDFFHRAKVVTRNFGGDELYLPILADIFKRQRYLLGYTQGKGIPITTNLIECFNSHLQGRLKTIIGLNSFHHANLWLNGYFLKRRSRKFTDCTGKFRGLNGKSSLQKTVKPGIDVPSFF